jgi:8-oxo-dGTP diphosphatase
VLYGRAVTTTARDVAALVSEIAPLDQLEGEHRADALAWLASTSDVFRRTTPTTPPKHLVAYFLLWDPRDDSVFLVHHRKAGLWLPTGGHVEVGEDPADTVRREASEELGIIPTFAHPRARPAFVTVTQTTGDIAARHVDVSLWYLLSGSQDGDLDPDMEEFRAVRWWARAELAAADPAGFEPHLARFLAKVTSSSA